MERGLETGPRDSETGASQEARIQETLAVQELQFSKLFQKLPVKNFFRFLLFFKRPFNYFSLFNSIARFVLKMTLYFCFYEFITLLFQILSKFPSHELDYLFSLFLRLFKVGLM